MGEQYTEVIGTAGGTIVSEDGLLEIEIPAGALTADTEIGIQPLTHTATSAFGNGYRLTPHGTIFKKKATVRFHYWKYKDQLGSVLAPEVAFQKETGEWVCTGGVTNDTTRKILSVKTDHFSDWGLIASMELSPFSKTIGAGKSVTLQGLRYVFPVKGDDWVVPQAHPNAGSGEPMKIEDRFIVRWRLDGPGKLETRGAEATYTAPASAPAHATATISLELNVHGSQVLLISRIRIVTEGIHISIDGGEWQTWPGWAVAMPETHQFSMSTLRTSDDIPQIVCMWAQNDKAAASGVFSWSMHSVDITDVTFEYDEPDLQRMYISIFDDGVRTYDSGGFLAVEEITENGIKYISGTFTIDKAGLLERATGQQLKTANIKGSFKLRRDW